MSLDEHQLFTSNNFDDLLKIWEKQNMVSVDHWTHFPHRSIRSSQEISFNLLDEIKQVIDEYSQSRSIHSTEQFIQRINSIPSNITHSHI